MVILHTDRKFKKCFAATIFKNNNVLKLIYCPIIKGILRVLYNTM